MFSGQDLLALGSLCVLMGVALWFSWMARTHFSVSSPRRPLMFGLEALSLAICVGTIWVVIVVGPRVPPVRSLVGFGLAFGASALFWSALRATRNRNFGVVFGGTVPQEVVKEGPYRYIRHPLYTAYLLNWIGCSVLAGSMILSLGTLAIASLYAFAARSEERDLLSSPLGKSYAEYKRNTGLLLPRVRAR